MTASQPDEEVLFNAARQIGDGAARARYLREAAGSDEGLLRRVEALLAVHDAPDRLLDNPAAPVPGGDETRAGQDSAGEVDEPLDFLAPSDKPGSLGRLGHYEVREVVGRGGMGVVLRAFDEKLHRVVAVKVMAPQLATSATARKRFAREARAAAAVRNEYVVGIYAVEDAAPLPYLVMEYVTGPSLQDRLDRCGPLGVAEILRIGMQAAAGLAAAHAQGLIHRDVKPANILLENGVERVKLTDFGLARAVDDASLTLSGVVAGTPQYMAPEQARGEAVDHRADLFSLGSVLYAMCTGRPPFRASGTMAVLKRVCEEQPRPVRESNPETPDWLVDVIARLHAKDPADRIQSAVEVAELLGRHLAHIQHPSAAPLPFEAKPTVPARRHWRVTGAVALVLIGGLVLTEATGATHLRTMVSRILTPGGPRVAQEPPQTDSLGEKVDARPFVLLPGKNAQNAQARRFETLGEAVQSAQDGDTVEIRGNGPIVTPPINIRRTALTIRAGEGFRPVIRLSPEGVQADGLLFTDAALVLEGLELQRAQGDPRNPIVYGMRAPLHVANCRFRSGVHHCIYTLSPDCEVRNCEFLCLLGVAVAWRDFQSGQRLVIDNCIQAGASSTLEPESLTVQETALARLTRNTYLTDTGAFQFRAGAVPALRDAPRRVKVVRVEASQNVIDARSVLHFEQVHSGKFLPPRDEEDLAGKVAGWHGERNLYTVAGPFLSMGALSRDSFEMLEPSRPITSLAGWKQFWHSPEEGSTQGRVRFQGGGNLLAKLHASPDKLVPEDFRLLRDSPGYRAGKDGKDLGADVDLVGPGPAYERWKKTPDYQQWLRDTGQVKK